VTDHRVGLTLHQLDFVMDGKLEPFVEALIAHYQTEKLKQSDTNGDKSNGDKSDK
jgi:peptide chain release factor 1